MTDIFQKNLSALKQTGTLLLPATPKEATAKRSVAVYGDGIVKVGVDGQIDRLQDTGLPDLKNRTVVQVMGFGTGVLLTELAKNPGIARILVYERDEDYFLGLLSSLDFSELFLSGKLRLILGKQNEKAIWDCCKRCFDRFLDEAGELFNGPVIENSSLRLWHDAQSEIQVFLKGVQLYLNEVMNFPRLVIQGQLNGLINTVKNFETLFYVNHINALQGAYADVPAISVGFGPSLAGCLDFLQEVQSSALICAVDVAVDTLVERGIIPDFVVSLERIGGEFCFKKSGKLENTYLVVPTVVQPEAVKNFQGPKLRMTLSNDYDIWLGGTDPEDYRPTLSGHVSYQVASKLGCGDIYLVGHDLSYDPFSGKSYSPSTDGYLEESAGVLRGKMREFEEFKVPGFFGASMTSCPMWLEARDIFSRLVALHPGQSFQVFPEGYGIPVYGAGFLPVADAKAALSRLAPKTRLESRLLTPVDRDAVQKRAAFALSRAKQNLASYQNTAIEVLHEISDFIIAHDMSYAEHRRIYDVFFVKIQSIQEAIRHQDRDFFETHFLSIFWPIHGRVGLNLAKIHYCETDWAQATYEKINQLYDWFDGLHLWSSRVLQALGKIN